jgi:general secretion pathway protein K
MRRREGGFALLIVLWTMVLLILIVTQMTSSGRTEAQLASNLRNAAAAEAAADGAVYDTVFHLIDPRPGTGHGSLPAVRALKIGGAAVGVRVENLAGRINPNNASVYLLHALMMAVGLDDQHATSLAAAIVDWRTPGSHAQPDGATAAEYRAAGMHYRPPGGPFQDIQELSNVLGMSPDVLGRLTPHMTLWWPDDPVPALADPVVRQALSAVGLVSAATLDVSNPVYAITATAVAPSGARFTRRAVVEARAL